MEDRPVLDQINLVVRDLAVAGEFYRVLGVDIPEGEAPWDRHHRSAETSGPVHLDLDSPAFASQWNRGWDHDRVGPVLGFRVRARTTVDALYERLVAAGHRGEQPPYDASGVRGTPWSSTQMATAWAS